MFACQWRGDSAAGNEEAIVGEVRPLACAKDVCVDVQPNALVPRSTQARAETWEPRHVGTLAECALRARGRTVLLTVAMCAVHAVDPGTLQSAARGMREVGSVAGTPAASPIWSKCSS